MTEFIVRRQHPHLVAALARLRHLREQPAAAEAERMVVDVWHNGACFASLFVDEDAHGRPVVSVIAEHALDVFDNELSPQMITITIDPEKPLTNEGDDRP